MTQTLAERAYQLAKSGKCANLAEVRIVLASEGYPSTIALSTIQLQGLSRLCKTYYHRNLLPEFRHPEPPLSSE